MTYEQYYSEKADKVGKLLWDLPLTEKGKKFNGQSIAENASPATREFFIDVVKSYIDRDFGHTEGFEILFTDDYAAVFKIRKQKMMQPITHV